MENESSEPIKIKKNTPLCQIKELKDVPETPKNLRKQLEDKIKASASPEVTEDDLNNNQQSKGGSSQSVLALD